MAGISLRGVHKVYAAERGASIVALTGIDLDVDERELVCLLGPSGCGKSTLLNIIAGFIAPTAGQCDVQGQPVRKPGPDRGVVFQEYGVLPWMTVSRNIEFGLKVAGLPAADRRRRVDDVLGKVGLRGFEREYPKSLSGGMKQRVSIARILALNPAVMLLDEPFGSLDALTRHSLQVELESLWLRDRKPVVFVTHNVEEALLLADRVVVMSARPGRIQQDVPVDLPRPRSVVDTQFNELRAKITDMVMAAVSDASAGIGRLSHEGSDQAGASVSPSIVVERSSSG